jgi:hydrogenase expression/formation protein HypC
MCLAIPGKVLEIDEGSELRTALVDFGGLAKRVSLVYEPRAAVGDYVLVHVGFAIGRIDEAEARRVFEYLDEMGELGELAAGPRGDR